MHIRAGSWLTIDADGYCPLCQNRKAEAGSWIICGKDRWKIQKTESAEKRTERIWLDFFNQKLLEMGMITEGEYNTIRAQILKDCS